MRNVDEIRRPSFFPSEKRKWRKKGEGGAAVAATGLRDLVKWASRSKSHPRASYASGNRSALWHRRKHFPAPKNLGLRGFMDLGAQALLAVCFCKVLRKDSVASLLLLLLSSLSFRRGRCFFVGTEGSSEENDFRIDTRELRGFGDFGSSFHPGLGGSHFFG